MQQLSSAREQLKRTAWELARFQGEGGDMERAVGSLRAHRWHGSVRGSGEMASLSVCVCVNMLVPSTTEPFTFAQLQHTAGHLRSVRQPGCVLMVVPWWLQCWGLQWLRA